MKKKKRIVALGVTGLVGASLVLGGVVFAATTSGSGGANCRMGYASDEAAVQGQNTVVSHVTLTKTCTGPAVANFTSEVTRLTNGVTAMGGIYMAATCTAASGANPCTPGSFQYANPGGINLTECVVSGTETCPSGPLGTRSAIQTWSSLKTGTWRFEVWENSGIQQYRRRALTVQAFNP